MKKCSSCDQMKDLADFGQRKSSKDGLQGRCKTCMAIYHRSWYGHNSGKLLGRKNALAKAWRKKKKEEFWEKHKSKPCVDCGQQFHPVAMQFDHLSDKIFDLASATSRSQERIEAEIAKCELVCANCHAVRTYQRKQGLR